VNAASVLVELNFLSYVKGQIVVPHSKSLVRAYAKLLEEKPEWFMYSRTKVLKSQ